MMKTGAMCFTLVIFLATFAVSSGVLDTQSQNVVNFHAMSKGQDEAWCEMCELIMDRVKVLIKEEDQQGKVNQTLFNLCDIIKGPMRRQCYGMVPMIKRQLTQGFNSHQACLMLQFCGGGNGPSLLIDFMSKFNSNVVPVWKDLAPIFRGLEPHIREMVHQYGLAKAKAGFSLTCMLCKTSVTALDNSLDQFKAPLIQYVVGICNSLPAPTNKACSDAMNYYIPSWWDAFFTDVASPNKLCTLLGICDEPVTATPPRTE